MGQMFEIPLPKNEDNFSIEVELKGDVFKFDFLWNSRSEAYALDIQTTQGESLVSVPLLTNLELIQRFQDSRLPKGNLFLKDVTGKAMPATREKLGDDFILYFEELD